ncbi:YagK/YfjJ domain-containing protein [Idiomarina abyssalis]|uniref:YagK/YfjJ domain-containing protein n=1 Tax=Idiomarina abyssalis TaxID=86102 RepID=UPI001CD7407C|nr:inovirus-type Gp2 protein [Idiomarina abyssalis]
MTTYTRNPFNRNQRLFNKTVYKGVSLWKQHSPYIEEKLHGLFSTLKKALDDHPRTLAVRFDLKVPVAGMPVSAKSPIERFIGSVQERINTKIKQKQREGKRWHRCNVRYVQKVEQAPDAVYEHYHVVLLVNNDMFMRVGHLGPDDNSQLAVIIREAWHNIVGVDENTTEVLVHGSTPANRRIKGPFSSMNPELRRAITHFSYLCKEETTLYRRGRPAFTTSRK